ncbi:MAG: ABC transporter substrate-binding protein, partial [Clostridia bacterium]|nr:ABC transporter substrate-binding protein [Clostridia bacterium]
MKRIIALVLAVLMAVSMLTACTSAPAPTASDADASATDIERVDVRLGGMTGPTTMGMVKLLADNEAGATLNNYDFTLAGGSDSLAPMLINGELDIAAVPANLASVLYNKTGGE